MENLLFSVIIPVYNGEKFLGETLESVVNQDYDPFEVIVVDDGSTDSSAEIIKSFSTVRYIYQKNQGNSFARNQGIKVSKGELIALIDQDDMWKPNKLSIHAKFYMEHPEVDHTTAKHRRFLSRGVRRPTWCREEWLQNDFTDYGPGSIVFRRKTFELVGEFDTSLVLGNDTDWLLRAKDKGIKMAILPEVLLLKRVHDDNQSQEFGRVNSELLEIFRRSIKRNKERKQDGK